MAKSVKKAPATKAAAKKKTTARNPKPEGDEEASAPVACEAEVEAPVEVAPPAPPAPSGKARYVCVTKRVTHGTADGRRMIFQKGDIVEGLSPSEIAHFLKHGLIEPVAKK